MRKIGIICAMEKELKPYLQDIKDTKITNVAMLSFHQGTINDVSIVAVYSGVGKVNAAIAAQILISKFQVDYVFVSGIAGGMTTGETFVNLEKTEALCIEMENADVAHVCYVNNIPFIAIRSISDNKKESGQEAINKNFDRAAYNSYVFVKEIISELRNNA